MTAHPHVRAPKPFLRQRRLSVHAAPAALLLAVPLAAAPFVAALAQEAEPVQIAAETEPLVVEATRIPTALDKTGTAVTVITQEDIERAQDRQVADSLQRVPGLNIVRNGSFGNQTSVFLRGANSEQTLVLIDGIEVNDPSSPGNGFDFGGLDASNVARIEVLRGPQSTLYGSEAIGGVISITTKSGVDGLEGNAFMEGGVFNTQRGSGTIRGGTQDINGALTLSGTRTNGISSAEADNGNDERDGFRDFSLAAKGDWAIAEAFHLDAAVNFEDQHAEFDGFPLGSPVPVDADEESDTQRIASRLTGTHRAFGGRLENKVSLKLLDIDRENESDGVTSFLAEGERKTVEYQGTVEAADWLTVSFGAEHEDNEFTSESPQFGTGDSGDFAITSGYGLVQVTPVERVTLNAGVRHDASDEFDGETTGRVSGAVDIFETGTTLRGLWGQGFKAPTPFQLSFVCSFCGAFADPNVAPAPNGNLSPETSRSWEIGVDQTILPGRLDVGLTYFNQEIDNLIDFDTNGRGFENISESEQQGVEATLTATVNNWTEVSANYTFLDAENVDAGRRLARRPRHKANMAVRLSPTDRLNLSTNVLYQGTTRDGDRHLDDFVLVSLRGAYDVHERLEVFARVENALDQDFQTASGFGQPDAAGFAGVRVSF